MATDNVNWNALRDEYLADTKTSYRKLAKKFGISYNAIWRRARDEGWVELRSQSAVKAATLAADAIAEARAEGAAAVVVSAQGLLVEFDKTVETMGASGIIKPKALKDLADALRAIQQVIDSQPTELDIDIKRAQLRKIQRGAEADDGADREISVSMQGLEDYAV